MNSQQKLERKVKQTLKEININKKSKIIVALSGGKDSSVVAYLLKKFGYNIEGFHIDLKIGKYSEECLEKVREISEMLEIKLHVYDMKKEMGSGMCYIRTAIQGSYKANKKGQLKNCAICGVIKKWIMNKEARKIKGAKYIATGHNLDDEAQTFLLNILKGSPKLSANSGAITKNPPDQKGKFIPRIKPLFYILEEDVKNYSLAKKLPVNYDKCPCALDSYRIQLRNFLEKMPGKDKENIMNNMDKIYPKIERLKDTENLGFSVSKTFKENKKFLTERIQYCKNCGEPSRNKICKKCELMNLSN
ncbi:MAG: ATP-binding protein [Candidatus Pacearchaeota archaeon]